MTDQNYSNPNGNIVESFTTAVFQIKKPADLGYVFGLALKADLRSRAVCREIWTTWCNFTSAPKNCTREWPNSIKTA